MSEFDEPFYGVSISCPGCEAAVHGYYPLGDLKNPHSRRLFSCEACGASVMVAPSSPFDPAKVCEVVSLSVVTSAPGTAVDLLMRENTELRGRIAKLEAVFESLDKGALERYLREIRRRT